MSTQPAAVAVLESIDRNRKHGSRLIGLRDRAIVALRAHRLSHREIGKIKACDVERDKDPAVVRVYGRRSWEQGRLQLSTQHSRILREYMVAAGIWGEAPLFPSPRSEPSEPRPLSSHAIKDAERRVRKRAAEAKPKSLREFKEQYEAGRTIAEIAHVLKVTVSDVKRAHRWMRDRGGLDEAARRRGLKSRGTRFGRLPEPIEYDAGEIRELERQGLGPRGILKAARRLRHLEGKTVCWWHVVRIVREIKAADLDGPGV